MTSLTREPLPAAHSNMPLPAGTASPPREATDYIVIDRGGAHDGGDRPRMPLGIVGDGIDIFVSSRFQGRGIGTDAVRTMARYVIEVRGHHRLTIDPAATNVRAIHVYGKVGFQAGRCHAPLRARSGRQLPRRPADGHARRRAAPLIAGASAAGTWGILPARGPVAQWQSS